MDGREVYGPMYLEAESFEKVPVLEAAPALGWEPQIGTDELILQTAEYYREREDYRQERERDKSAYAAT